MGGKVDIRDYSHGEEENRQSHHRASRRVGPVSHPFKAAFHPRDKIREVEEKGKG